MQASFISVAPRLLAQARGAVRADAFAAAAVGEAILSVSKDREENGALAQPAALDDPAAAIKVHRKERVPITIGVKKELCRLRSKGFSWSAVLAKSPKGMSQEADRKVYRARDAWLSLPDDSRTEMRTVLRKGTYAGVGNRLRSG